ncbi:hypothetical protein [uncultured Muribaculum sp.]|nr:hypothetical protein [uncultured Muribaculum sp.]
MEPLRGSPTLQPATPPRLRHGGVAHMYGLRPITQSVNMHKPAVAFR